MKKKIGLISLFAAGLSAVALTGCDGSDPSKADQSEVNKVSEEVKALQTSLNEAKSSLEESISKINLYLRIEQITANGDAIASLEQKIEQLRTSTESTAETLAPKETLDAAIVRLQAVETSLSTEYVKKENYDTAIAELTSISASLQAAVGDVITDGDSVLSLQAQITRLEAAKATVARLEAVEALLNTKTKELQDKIDLITAEIGEIAKDDNDEIISVQAQIDEINAKIGAILLDDNQQIISLQAQIDDIRHQIGDYGGSSELKKLKGDLVYKLSDSYATFQDEMTELRVLLTETYHKNVESLFLDIQKKYNHEMSASLYEGITLIILSQNAQEATETEAEYEVLINNYINPAKFELIKNLDLAIIASIDSTIDVASGSGNLTVRQKLTNEVNAVEWFETLPEEFKINDDDDDDTRREKTLAYKAATQAKIDLMNAAVAKAETIYDFLTQYNTSRASIIQSLSAANYSEAKAAFVKILDEEIYDLTAYYDCENINIDVTEIDPTTQTEVQKTYNDLEYEYLMDSEELGLILAEVADYIALNNYVNQELEKVNIGNGKLAYVASKVDGLVTELTKFNAQVNTVIDYTNYAKLNNTIAKSSAQLAEDKAIVDLYITKGKAYDQLIKYCNDSITSVSDTLKTSTEEEAEKATVNTIIGGIHQYANYITADLVIAVPADNTDTSIKSVSQQLQEDKAAADLLVKRAATFKHIYDAINANTLQLQGLVAYIDNKTTAVNQGDTNLFTAELKTKFKAEFTDYAVASKYDIAIKDYTTQQQFTNYEELLLKDGGKLDLIKKNVDVFANILVIDNTAKTTINGHADLSSDYKAAFIANFEDYATYETNNTNTKDFATKAAFDTYYTDTVKSMIDNIVKVAKYENDLTNKAKAVGDKVVQAYSNNKISESVEIYLILVSASIYLDNTSVTVTDEDELVTKQTIESDAYTTVAAKLTAVQDAITTFNNIDVAAKLLETKLNSYKQTQEDIFLNTNYRYRDDEVYAPEADYNKYHAYNQAALNAWLEYEDEFDDKIDEITYEYEVPTSETELNYDSFVNFMSGLESPSTIGDRYNGIELWYTENTQENPEAGMLYTIKAKYEELDSQILDECKEFFIGELEALKDELKALVSSEDYKGNLENIFVVNKGIINGEYGTTTSSIIYNYEQGVSALETEFGKAIKSYRTNALLSLLEMYNAYKADYPDNEYVTRFTTIYDKYNTTLSASEYSYIVDEEIKKEAWTEEIIDGLLSKAEEEFEYVTIIAYKNDKLLDLDTEYTNYTTLKPEYSDLYQQIYFKYFSIINRDKYIHVVDEEEVEDFWTKDIIDELYDATIDEFDNAYKNKVLNDLDAKYEDLSTNVFYSVDLDSAYDQIRGQIEDATDEDMVDSLYAAGVLTMAKVAYKGQLEDFYQENLEFVPDFSAEDYEGAYNDGIEAINNATTEELVETAYDAAVDNMYDYIGI